MAKEYIQTDKAPSAIGAYSQAVKHDGIVYLSGQIPLDPKRMSLVSDNIDDQIHQVFAVSYTHLTLPTILLV